MPKERLSFGCAHTFRFDSSRLAGAKALALRTPRHVPWSSQRMAKLTNAEARKTWEAAAPGWATWEEVFASGFRDATAQMLDIAAVAPDAKVLDLACGAGGQTFQAAERVGADGAIVASDISATMRAMFLRGPSNRASRILRPLNARRKTLTSRTISTRRSAG